MKPRTQLDGDKCYQAALSNDARFDGRFFTAVKTTHIYCRSICSARMPLRRNIEFYPTAAAAELAGFRACRRCRPDASPGTPAWAGTSAIVSRALREINEGALDREGVSELSGRLGVGERHLTRLFVEHLGAAPIAIAQTRRAHFAKRLIEETRLPMAEIAFSSGFGSIRRFNASVKNCFDLTPTELRGRVRSGKIRIATPARFVVRLSYRPPFDWPAFLNFLSVRATPGVESVNDGVYRRTIRFGADTGTIGVRHSEQPNSLTLDIEGRFSRDLLPIVERVRDLFDLRADPLKIESHLRQSRLLGAMLDERSVPRVPGAWDGFELAVRAILGQQVSVRGATTVAGRLAARYGEPVNGHASRLTVLFPTPEALAAAEIEGCGFPGSRGRAITLLARAVSEGKISLTPSADPEDARMELQTIPGIGPWTADYISMRALSQPDAFPKGDLGLRKAASTDGRPMSPRRLEIMSEEWRPWRAYAAMLLWNRF